MVGLGCCPDEDVTKIQQKLRRGPHASVKLLFRILHTSLNRCKARQLRTFSYKNSVEDSSSPRVYKLIVGKSGVKQRTCCRSLRTAFYCRDTSICSEAFCPGRSVAVAWHPGYLASAWQHFAVQRSHGMS